MSQLFASGEEPIKVLIVGAGPSGLSVAKALQNRGIYPDVIEREEQIRADGAGIAIPANGSWALSRLGIAIGQEALLHRSMLFTDDQGELLIEEKIDAIHPEGAQFYSLGRDALLKHLLSSLDQRTHIQTATTITRFSEENEKVKVAFSNGQEQSYDWVIGCDGVHSSLRRQVHPSETAEFLNLLVWRAVIEAPEGIDRPTYMLGSDRMVLLYPMPERQTYIYGHVFQSEKSPPPDTFSNVFSPFGGQMRDVLGAIDRENLAPGGVRFFIHHMEKSHSVRFRLEGFSRVLLMGDAAHAFGPGMQNGAAQAFEDAFVLQDLLTDRISADQIPALIETFEKRRTPRVQSVFAMSNAKVQAISNPELIQGRNAAIRKSGAPNVNGFKLLMQQNP